ncbi:aminotransferase class I/II-fold pyridoxal phosphate-dependent enzyme [Chitinophaga sp. HK235]|uniref:aminotransferase class I/II-fold pyridoxal phosphate-dependent enzyme n=1 Tax=Chitinophaga sp. HK235 TaxID=2952571 RepID=UPI001BACB415|nr:aminotransferase class I/II-fold pyridoxal phosphate-dependent enzyme [Chitinophaga sp. HK235]
MQYLSNDMYTRLIDAFTIAAYQQCDYLDLVNFNREIYGEVINSGIVEDIFKPSYGYGAPDGSFELGKLVKALETARIQQYNNWLKKNYPAIASTVLGKGVDMESLAVGSGMGTTGVMGSLLKSIFDMERPRFAGKPDVVLCVPNYSVYDGIVNAHGGKSKYLLTKAENSFLPTVEEVSEAIDENTVALVLTYPNNPAQSTYEPENLQTLVDIVKTCQDKKVYLIVDNIYQETIWDENMLNPEIFSLTEKPDYLFKVFGASKDRPFFSGLRMGYMIGDPRIKQAYQYYASLFNNTHNNHTSLVFAIDLLFRKKMLDRTPLVAEDVALMDTFLAGWNVKMDVQKVLDGILDNGLFEHYKKMVHHSNTVQAESMSKIITALHQLPLISAVVNGNIGNVIFAKANPALFGGNCDVLFRETLNGARLGILPGNVFGMPQENGHAWFRITTIHEPAEVIINRLELMNDHFLRYAEMNAAVMETNLQ